MLNSRKKNKFLLYACILLVTLSVWKFNSIVFRLNRITSCLIEQSRTSQNEALIKKLHEHQADLSGLKALTSNGDEWFAKYHFISHNGCIIQGRLHSDSLEAWELSYKRGNRIIDADLEFTADNIPVLRHGWGENLEQGHEPEPMNYKDFMNAKIFRKYTPMSLNDMITFMKSHNDLYVALDSKQDL